MESGRPNGQLTPNGSPARTSERPHPVSVSSPAAGTCVELLPIVSDGDTDLLLLPQPAASTESTAAATNERDRSRVIGPPCVTGWSRAHRAARPALGGSDCGAAWPCRSRSPHQTGDRRRSLAARGARRT